MRMKAVLAVAIATCALGFGQKAMGVAVQTDFAGNGKLRFDALGNFYFDPAINLPTSFLNMLDYGTVGTFSTGGPFAIGAINTPSPGVQVAPVTGSPVTLTFGDGLGNNWVGTFNWMEIRTSSGSQSGTVGIDGTLMFTSRTYSGPDLRLQELRDFPDTHIFVSWPISRPLEDLAYYKTHSDSYSYAGHLGAAKVPDAASTAGLLGLAMGGMAWLRRRAA
jgi:hypothetical protein